MSDMSSDPIPLLLSKVALNTFTFLIWGGGKEKNRQVFVKKKNRQAFVVIVKIRDGGVEG